MLEPLPEPDRPRFNQMLKVSVGHASNEVGSSPDEGSAASS
jgi:hypothetical protein